VTSVWISVRAEPTPIFARSNAISLLPLVEVVSLPSLLFPLWFNVIAILPRVPASSTSS